MAYIFPGMDPYLEGYLWSDVHHALAYKIREQLTPLLRPKYVARLEQYTIEDTNPSEDVGIMYPDVGVLLRKKDVKLKKYVFDDGHTQTLSPVSVSVPTLTSVKVRIPVIEIKDAATNRLITVIEILSPVNKRVPGLKPYRRKRRKLHQSKVHLLEIDLLRRGTRPLSHPILEDTTYLVGLTRSESALTDFWKIKLENALPVVPVPLLREDKDVPLNLQKAIEEVYEDAGYDISIDYNSEPPPPKLPEEEWEWIKGLVKEN
ncbi:MAG: DUF4058 family protein [Chitinophagales bacterium]